MKIIKFSIALTFILLSTVAKAQTILPKGELSYMAWGNIASDGQKLTDDDLRDVLDAKLYTDYTAARRKYVSGKTLCCIGIPLAVVSTIGIIAGSSAAKSAESMSNLGNRVGALYWGGIGLTGSLVLLGIGAPKFFIGRNKIKRVVENYNHQNGFSYEPSMSFGAQQYGIGVAFNF